jgi:hypothetical protein
LAALSLGLCAMLGVAAWLEPAAQGFGTHEQHGLPMCNFFRIVRRPCPSCGMTTAWTHAVRGQWRAAVQANAAGTLLAAAAPVAAVWAGGSAVCGRFWGRPSQRWAAAAAVVLAVVVLADWLRRLAEGGWLGG